MSLLSYSVYTLAYLGLIVWALRVFTRTRRAGTLFLALVSFGLFYDNLALTLGGFLPAGDLLHNLSWPRYFFHQLLLPWVIVAAVEQAGLLGAGWASHPTAKKIFWAATFLLMVYGLTTRVVGLQLEPEVLDGINRYSAANVSGPPVTSILSITGTGLVGIWLWRCARWPWHTLTALLVIVGQAIPNEAIRQLSGSGIEVLYMVVLILLDQRQLSKTD